jgi:hypothetical protein
LLDPTHVEVIKEEALGMQCQTCLQVVEENHLRTH